VYLILTVYRLFIQKKIRRGQGAPVFVRGGGAPVPWHNGTMASPSLSRFIVIKYNINMQTRRKGFLPETDRASAVMSYKL